MHPREAALLGLRDARVALVALWHIAAGDSSLLQRSWSHRAANGEEHDEVETRCSEALATGDGSSLRDGISDLHLVSLARAADGVVAARSTEPRPERVGPIPIGPDPRPTYHLIRRRSWDADERGLVGCAPSHRILPVRSGSWRIEVSELSGSLDPRLAAAAQPCVWTAVFADGVTTEFTSAPSVRCRGLVAAGGGDAIAARVHSVTKFLEAADAGGAHIAVLPEFTTPQAVVDAASSWLSTRYRAADPASRLRNLRVVVSGSFHRSDGARVGNVAVTLDRSGRRACWHAKILLADAVAAGQLGFPDSGREDCTPGDVVRVLVTRLGTIVTPIGREFGDPELPDLNGLWRAVSPDWALCLAYGNDRVADMHESCAETHAEHGQTNSVLALQPAPTAKTAACFWGRGCQARRVASGAPVDGTVRANQRF